MFIHSNRRKPVTEATLSPPKAESFWRRAGRFLRTLDEAVHTTEADRIAARVDWLERQLGELKAQIASPPAPKGDLS
jgi:hypothetical protein